MLATTLLPHIVVSHLTASHHSYNAQAHQAGLQVNVSGLRLFVCALFLRAKDPLSRTSIGFDNRSDGSSSGVPFALLHPVSQ